MEIQPDGQPDLLQLLLRQSEIQRAMRRPGGIRITVERELQAIREQLKKFPLVSRARAADVASVNPACVASPGGVRTSQTPRP